MQLGVDQCVRTSAVAPHFQLLEKCGTLRQAEVTQMEMMTLR